MLKNTFIEIGPLNFIYFFNVENKITFSNFVFSPAHVTLIYLVYVRVDSV